MPRLSLTRSQLRCVRLAGEGLSDKQIAQQLGVSHRTVQDHMQSAFKRLGVSDRWAAVAAIREKYGELPVPIAGTQGSQPDEPADASSPSEPRRGEGPVSVLLMSAYIALDRLGRPRRVGGSLAPMILVYALLGLILLGTVLALANALIGSANDFAARAYANA